jgi:hypothetical protein
MLRRAATAFILCSSLAFATGAGADSQSSAASASGAESAERRDWEIEFTPYLWVAMVDGEIDTSRYGNRHIKADVGDVLKAFDLGAMGAASVRWKRFIFLTDFAWSRLSDRDGVGDSLVRYELTQEVGWVEFLAGYRVWERAGGLLGSGGSTAGRSFDVDAFAGLTYTSLDNKLELRRDPLDSIPAQERTIRERNDWAAPFIALRLRNDFSDRIEAETFVGVGGFGAGDAPDAAWQANALLGYAVTKHVKLTAGYRAQGAEKGNIELTLHGPVLGASLRY